MSKKPTKEQWQQYLLEYTQSNLTVSSFCEAKGISRNAFYHRLRTYDSEPKPAKAREQTQPKQSRRPAPIPVVEEVPAVCPTCGSSKRTGRANIVRRDMSGDLNGRRYEAITWAKVNCVECGQRYNIRKYEFTADIAKTTSETGAAAE